MEMVPRRVFVSSLAALFASAEQEPPVSDLRRVRDPATENELLRYTDPGAYSAWLLPLHLRSMSQRGTFMLICSDRGGSVQLYRMELKGGELSQITFRDSASQLKGAALLPDDRNALSLDGSTLELVSLSSPKTRVLHTTGGGSTAEALAVSDTGRSCYVLERDGDRSLVLEVGIAKRTVQGVVEEMEPVGGMRPRPRSAELLYRKGQRLFLRGPAARTASELRTAADVGQAFWSADGRSVHYVTAPSEAAPRVQLREHVPETGEDTLVANTSAFVNFAANRNGSVFVGVSGSKGSPHILLLLRASRRELTLCEHAASSAEAVVVVFTPDSQRIFFHTDRGGRPAVYAIPADKLVEPTDT